MLDQITNSYLANLIILFMLDKGYEIFIGDKFYNIVYVEYLDFNNQCAFDCSGQWNDRRIIIEIPHVQPVMIGNWLASTCVAYQSSHIVEPSRITLGQQKVWQLGIEKHCKLLSLVQCLPVLCQPCDLDGNRQGYPYFVDVDSQINHTYSEDGIDNSPYASLVGQSIDGHRRFINILKQDTRFLVNPQHVFSSTVINSIDLINFKRSIR